MPLLKRFETELVPEWRKQCIDYKGLKKRAESLVGSEKACDIHAKEQEDFQQFFSHEMEKISHLYAKQERKLCKFFCAMEAKVDSLSSAINQNRKDFVHEDGAPNPERIFADSANKQVPVAMLAFMVHIDALRTFALLNTLAVLHIAQRHCSKLLYRLVLERLYQEPFYHCSRLSTLVDEIARISNTFLDGSVGTAVHHNAATAETDAVDYLSACCTWANQKGRVPPWVCKSLPSSKLQGDRRSLRVQPLVQKFVSELSARLHSRGLASMVPDLVKQMSVKPSSAPAQRPLHSSSSSGSRRPEQAPVTPKQASRPASIPERSEASWCSEHQPAGPRPSGPVRQSQMSGSRSVVPPPRHVEGGHVSTPARPSTLRLTRSCRDLQALSLSSPPVPPALRLHYAESVSSGYSSSVASTPSSGSSSPPLGASPPSSSGVTVPTMGSRSRDNLHMKLARLEERENRILPTETGGGRDQSVMMDTNRHNAVAGPKGWSGPAPEALALGPGRVSCGC